MRYFILLFCSAVSFCLSPLSSANTSQIETLKQENSGYYKTIERNENRISSNNDKIEKTVKAIEDAKLSLSKYQETHILAQEKYEQNSNPENLRVLEMNGKRKTLAEKKIETREKRLEDLKIETAKLTASSKWLDTLIKRNESKIENLDNEAAQKRKLQASIKAKEERQAKIEAPKLPAIALTPKQATAPESPKTNQVAPKTSNIVAEQTAPNVSAPSSTAVTAIAEIKDYLSSNANKNPKHSLRVATTHRGQKIKVSLLGDDIYRGEVELKKGDHTIIFSGSRFRINVSEKNDRKLHVLYIDYRADKRKIIFAEKSLEDQA